jgi:general secretion pathway protein D
MVRTDTPEKFQLGSEDLPDPREVEPSAPAALLPEGQAVPNTADVPQIMIEVKFIEAPESLVASLPIGRSLVPPGSTNQARSLSETEFRQLLRELEETPGVDLMAAPRVTTLSGQQAQIQIVEIKSVVTGLDPGASQVPAGEGTATSPPIESVPVGPTLDVIPRVTENGDGFDLLVLASVKDLVGHIEPGSSHFVPAGATVATEGAPLPLPVFRERRLTTRVTLPQGQTLLLMEGSPAAGTTGNGPTPAETLPAGRRFLVLMTPTLVTETGRPIALQAPTP